MRRLGVVFLILFLGFSSTVLANVPKRPIDLNSASVRQLMVLPGIGRHRARRIVLMRERKPFRRSSELLKIRGIGRKLYHRLRPFVHVVPPKAALTKR